MTTACGSMFRICSRHSKPSCPLTASRLKFISSKTTSGWNVRIKCSIRAGCVVTLIFCIYGSSSIFKANKTSSLSSIINIFPFFRIIRISIYSKIFNKWVNRMQTNNGITICICNIYIINS